MKKIDNSECTSANCFNIVMTDSGIFCYDCIRKIRRKLKKAK